MSDKLNEILSKCTPENRHAAIEKIAHIVEVKVKRLHPDAVIPTKAHAGDAGFDLVAVEDTIIEPGETALIKTGLAFELPEGFEMQIRPRSGVTLKTKLRVQFGTVDSNYRGEVGVIVDNISNDTWSNASRRIDNTYDDSTRDKSRGYLIRKGDRIAQAVIQRLPDVELVEVEALGDSERARVLMVQQDISKSVFLGAMIGDGSISRSSPTANARFRVGHSIDKSEYLMWKLKHLREVVQITDIGILKGGVYEKSPNDYVYFNSRRDSVITEMYERLYIDGKKTLSEDLVSEIDEVALSVIFMDDGSYDANIDNLNYWLHLNSHSKTELDIFTDHLREKFDINPKLQLVNKGAGYALRFLRGDSERIDQIIRPIVSQIECMKYKLHFDNPRIKDLKWSNVLTKIN